MPQPGALVLTLNLGETAPSLGRAVPGPREEMAETLLQMLDRRRLAATWSMPDPASSDFALRVANSRRGHEVALCADRTWAGQGVRRPRLCSELGQRLNRMRARCPVSSLFLSGVRLDQQLDVLVKSGISSLIITSSGTADAHRSRAWAGRAGYLRFGLWELEATACFPARGDWMWRGAGVTPQATSPAIASPGLPVNLVAIDIAPLVAKGARSLRLIDRVFRLAAEYRDAGRQDVLTAGSLALRLARPRQLLPARSILRAA